MIINNSVDPEKNVGTLAVKETLPQIHEEYKGYHIIRRILIDGEIEILQSFKDSSGEDDARSIAMGFKDFQHAKDYIDHPNFPDMLHLEIKDER